MAKEFVTTGCLKVDSTFMCRHVGLEKENVLLQVLMILHVPQRHHEAV